MVDTVTVLQALPHRRGGTAPVLAKRWRAGADTAPFALPIDSARWFAVHERAVDGLDALEALLRRVEQVPSAAIVRGRPAEGIDRRRCERLSNPIDGRVPTFLATPRRWLMLDVDGLEDPPCDDMRSDPLACVEHALCRLPDELAEASCWWQASGSAGFKPGVRVHLWFWLSRPVSDDEAAGWLAGAPVDARLMHPVQLHYVAAPVLQGLADPLRIRSGRRPGLVETVAVPDELPQRPPAPALAAVAGDVGAAIDGEWLRRAVRRSRLLQAIWRGERRYDDRSRAHFALVVDLLRAGLDDLATLRGVLVAVDRRCGWDPTKSLHRDDYLLRTVARARALLQENRT